MNRTFFRLRPFGREQFGPDLYSGRTKHITSIRSLAFAVIAIVGLILGAGSALSQQTTLPGNRPTDTDRGRRQSRGGNKEDRQKGGGRGEQAASFQTVVPEHPWDIVAARPTAKSITLSVLAYQETEGYIAYGTESGKYTAGSPKRMLKSGQPLEIIIGGLTPNTNYYYKFCSRPTGVETFECGSELTFVTARPAGSDFTFAIQADSHLDDGVDLATYKRSLTNIADARPDFMIDLGDTFMTDKYAEYKLAESQYLAQRYYLGLVNRSVPLFLTIGNHDGEAGWRRGGGDENIFDWSNTNRKKYFPNPVPDEFYSGNTARDRKLGDLQDYYSWEWGDALFVVLDPFTFTTSRSRGDDNWGWTLGKQQYDWLKTTLENSKARYKFVFIHHLVGGSDRVARGGSEAAQFFEWGGNGLDGRDEFAARRPDLAMPIHRLLVKNGVSAVFHGHDHLFAKQELDGIVYQEVPQPGHSRVDNIRNAAEYGYKSGVILGSSGVLIVRTTRRSAKISYVRAFPDGREGAGRKNGTVEYEYEIAAKK